MQWPVPFDRILRRHCRFLDDDTPIDGQASLGSLGVDSLEIVELIVALEEEFAVEIPPHLLTPQAFANPDAIWSLLRGVSPELAEAGR
ncbi:phosphopantetheine-binding protein [Streptomyces chartreusis]|uniref:phosphopantetheine-binding protein n=1 Tax=Streptomyces chartreusis TaxID=1969 RepID=UPI0033B3DE66